MSVSSKQKITRKAANKVGFALPTKRRAPVDDPWRYAYLLTGEKKIGKTTFAIEGAEEIVAQCDKPQLAYPIREVMIESWRDATAFVKAIEDKAATQGGLGFDRIVIDGAGELWNLCQQATCKHFGVDHPSEEGYARAWHKLRDDFTDFVNRLLRIQAANPCGLVFIAHSEWKEKQTHGGPKVERLVPNLSSRCEEILNGKVDAWFQYDYFGDKRGLIVAGDERIAAGHRINGHFKTRDGRPLESIEMGDSASDAMQAFRAAFANELEHASMNEARAARIAARKPTGGKISKKVGKKVNKRRPA